MNDSVCDKCQTASGTPHTFHYGKKAGLPTDGPPPAYRAVVHGDMHSAWTEHFEVGGMDAVILCDRCLTRARMRRALRRVLHDWIGVPLITVLYVLWAVGVAGWGGAGARAQTPRGVGVGRGVTVAV
jgi:hypothetical protein